MFCLIILTSKYFFIFIKKNYIFGYKENIFFFLHSKSYFHHLLIILMTKTYLIKFLINLLL